MGADDGLLTPLRLILALILILVSLQFDNDGDSLIYECKSDRQTAEYRSNPIETNQTTPNKTKLHYNTSQLAIPVDYSIPKFLAVPCMCFFYIQTVLRLKFKKKY